MADFDSTNGTIGKNYWIVVKGTIFSAKYVGRAALGGLQYIEVVGVPNRRMVRLAQNCQLRNRFIVGHGMAEQYFGGMPLFW